MQMVQSSPIIGVGLNNYLTVAYQYEPYGVKFPGFPAHNFYLLTWAETGTLGLLATLAGILALLGCATRLAQARDPFFASLGVGLAASYVCFMVEETVAYTLRHSQGHIIFALLAGVTIAAWRLAYDARAPGREPNP